MLVRASGLFLTRILGVAAGGVVLNAGCNSILGIDEGHLVENGGSTGTGGSSAEAGPTGGNGGGNVDSGAGGVATGGSSTGGKGNGGASSGGRGGTGGRSSGGAGGQSGGGAGGATGPSGLPGEVQCGTSICMLPGQACCVPTGSAMGAPHCSATCDTSTQDKFSCDGSEDCASGEHCCLPTLSVTAACSTNCTGRVFCGAAADCAPGQYCAPGAGALATVFVCTDPPKTNSVWCNGLPCDVSAGKACCYDKTTKTQSCSATCGANDVRFDCDSDSDCATGSSCCENHTGLGVAIGTQCVAGGCPSGRAAVECGGADACAFCCASGGGTTCSMSACVGEVACGTAADCKSGQTCSTVTTAVDLATGRNHCL